MNNHDEEAEIKIEYYESFDVDPLSEYYEKSAAQNVSFNDSILYNCVVSNDNKLMNQESRSTKNIVEINDISNTDHLAHGRCEIIGATWYKSVDDSGRYLCKFCELSYSTVQTVRNHVKLKHIEGYNQLIGLTAKNIRQPKLKCHICKKRFNEIHTLKQHIKAHGINNIQNSCHICYASFEDSTKMFNHILEKHNSRKKIKHFCDTCGYSTHKLSHYKQHTNTHTREDKKKCTYCDYSTNHPPNLKIHERIHTNIRPYRCNSDGCDYSCVAKSALYSHRLKHDKENNMLYCDKCSYQTVYKQSLKNHADSHRRNNIKIKI